MLIFYFWSEKLQTLLKLKIYHFQASNGWIESFLSRNNIQFKSLSGKSSAVNVEASEDWKRKLGNILQDYTQENWFSADETGLFYRQIPRKSLVLKGDSCKGGKLAKERLSILFCCSSTREKLVLLVTEHSEKPRAFCRALLMIRFKLIDIVETLVSAFNLKLKILKFQFLISYSF